MAKPQIFQFPGRGKSPFAAIKAFDVAHALDFAQRSPYETRQTPGLPPALTPTPQVDIKEAPNGQIMVNGVPIAPLSQNAQQAAVIPPPPAVHDLRQQINPLAYGDMTVNIISYVAGGDQLVLQRPSNRRIFLFIENDLVAPNSIRINFDKNADANSGLRLDAGGNVFFDAVVPQNDIHIFAPVAGNVILGYINSSVGLTG